MDIPEWKWESIAMDFVVGLPRMLARHDSIWVIIDGFTKTDHFLSIKTTYFVEKYAKLYIAEIVRLHGAPTSIISDRDPKFTSCFGEHCRKLLGLGYI